MRARSGRRPSREPAGDDEVLLVDARTLRVRGRVSLNRASPPASRLPGSPTSRTGHTVRATSRLPELTERERDVLDELATGKSTAEIAAALHLSPGTVKGYLSGIMAKWDARDRVQLIVFAVRSGVIVLD